ncbi:MAG: EscU/YscU/HrcU family type III secretion system export apparatus switch protein [Spirochaetaceae bacterium]|nr:EscU/YscU/HrcU family type III secretion system export apparatus switch protein [Spirochaetaceae bacterium]
MKEKTKVSVALSYTFGEKAPIVVASGKGETAKRIEEIAKKHNIKIVTDPNLAHLLSEVEIGNCIPEETYEAIASIFAFLEKKYRF